MRDVQTIATALAARKVSSEELVRESLHKIERLNPKINAFITVDADGALEAARRRDDELQRGYDRGLLHGIPTAHKDLIRTKGLRTTAGSKILADYIPKHDAEVTVLLREAGAVSLGKTGLHEFAYGITSNNPHFGAVRNPWILECSPGGSSGGSAAAIAAGIVPWATGSDTGGSIRIPASFCGVVGLKPTFGKVSVRGVMPLGPSQDHIGPMAGTVRDAAIAYYAMIGLYAMITEKYGNVPPFGAKLDRYRIGVPRNFFFDRIQNAVAASVDSAVQTAAELGAQIVEIDVPDMEAVRWAAVTTLLSEASVVLKRHLNRRADFGDDVLALVEKGLAVPAVDYIEAQRIRKKSRVEFAKMFEKINCLFTPTTPIVAPKIGQTIVEINGQKEEVRAAATRLTRGMNALGFPAISIPCALAGGLPIGLQIIANMDREDTLFRVGAAMEDALAFSELKPALS